MQHASRKPLGGLFPLRDVRGGGGGGTVNSVFGPGALIGNDPTIASLHRSATHHRADTFSFARNTATAAPGGATEPSTSDDTPLVPHSPPCTSLPATSDSTLSA